MARKYSINMENDAVVSVEVNGVSYASPEDIPDAQDRQQVERMIARMNAAAAGGEDEDAFDQQFEADIAEMRRDTARMPVVIAGVFLLVALICLTIAVISGLNAARHLAREVSAPARVVDMIPRSSRDSETGEVTVYSYPVVEFQPEGLPPRKVQLSEGSFPPAYAVGDRVTVLYDPMQPNEARIQSAASSLLLWLLPGITGLVGLAFTGAAVTVWKLMRAPEPAAVIT